MRFFSQNTNTTPVLSLYGGVTEVGEEYHPSTIKISGKMLSVYLHVNKTNNDDNRLADILGIQIDGVVPFILLADGVPHMACASGITSVGHTIIWCTGLENYEGELIGGFSYPIK